MNEITIIPLGTVSPYPKGNKNCPGFLIKYKDNNIMLDCGNGCTRLLNMEEDLNNLKIFISHLHPDHYGDLVSLLQTINVYKKYGYVKGNIDIYIPPTKVMEKEDYVDTDGWGCSRTIETNIIDYKYIERYTEKVGVSFHDYSSSTSVKVDDINITNIKVPHPIESHAFKLENNNFKIVYSSDTGTKNNLREFSRNADLFICESTFLKGQNRIDGHLFAYEAAEIARDAQVKKLLLTHFWPEIDKEKYLKEAKEVFNNTEVAIEGKKLILRRNYGKDN